MEDIIICRCQEVTRREILDAIADGATTVDGVKRRTRAGMGLCQGKTCERLVAKIIAEQTGRPMAEILPPKVQTKSWAIERPIPKPDFFFSSWWWDSSSL